MSLWAHWARHLSYVHCQLVADICGLERTTEIERYLRAPFYRIGVSQLCGVDSPFSELTMLSPNTYLTVCQT